MAAQHGGPRNGAGRKKGAATRKTRAVANQEAEKGPTPLGVLMEAMRRHVAADRWDEAAAIAKDAAPYMHPRLSSVQMEHTGGVRLEVVKELAVVDGNHSQNGAAAPGAAGVH